MGNPACIVGSAALTSGSGVLSRTIGELFDPGDGGAGGLAAAGPKVAVANNTIGSIGLAKVSGSTLVIMNHKLPERNTSKKTNEIKASADVSCSTCTNGSSLPGDCTPIFGVPHSSHINAPSGSSLLHCRQRTGLKGVAGPV
jgi:hypothetical protein